MTKFHKRYWCLWDEAKDIDSKISRAEFAKRMGVTVGQSNGWLDGGTEPDCESLLTIAKNAGVSVSWLVGETGIRRLNMPDLLEGLPTDAVSEMIEFSKYLRYKYKVE